MRQGDPVTNGGAAEFLAFQHRIEDRSLAQRGMAGKATAQALQKLFLARHRVTAQQDTRHQVRSDHGMALK